MNETLNKVDVMKMIDLNINKWMEMKGRGSYDVTHENFIDDVILVYQWVLRDVEQM